MSLYVLDCEPTKPIHCVLTIFEACCSVSITTNKHKNQLHTIKRRSDVLPSTVNKMTVECLPLQDNPDDVNEPWTKLKLCDANIKSLDEQHGELQYIDTFMEEPHATRRRQMLKKYPQIKRLFGPDRLTALRIGAIVSMQLFLIVFVAPRLPWWALIPFAWTVGGVANHALMMAIHECCHNLVFGFKHVMMNNIMAIVANLPIGIPCSISFKKYHLEHHRNLGEKMYDPGIPTREEAIIFFRNKYTKIAWIIGQGPLYMLRPLWVSERGPLTRLHLINISIEILFDCLVLFGLGWPGGVKALFYMIGGTWLGMGPHPIGVHYIAEHYMWKRGTLSYYGWLNVPAWNIGYHNEHHDFPYVSAFRLPQLKQIAPEYYDDLPQCSSWLGTVVDFILDDSFDHHYVPGVEVCEKPE